jgi:putative membrane protein
MQRISALQFRTFAAMDGNYLLAAKSLHIIFVVAWFAGLFYVPRLFIYQTESREAPEAARGYMVTQFKLMTRRLWYIITWPACILSTLFAVWMLVIYPTYLSMPWMHLKLGLVVLLLAYHGSLQWIFLRLQRDVYPMSSMQLRMYNEVATLLLFAIVFTVVYKNTSSWYYGVAGILALGILLMLAVRLYKRLRKN